MYAHWHLVVTEYCRPQRVFFWLHTKSLKSTTLRRKKYFHPYIWLSLCSYAQAVFTTTALQLDTAMPYARNSKCATITNFSAIPQYFFRINIMGNRSSLSKVAEMDSKLAQQEMGTARQKRVGWSTKCSFWVDGAHMENRGGMRNTHQAEGLMARAESKHKLDWWVKELESVTDEGWKEVRRSSVGSCYFLPGLIWQWRRALHFH